MYVQNSLMCTLCNGSFELENFHCFYHTVKLLFSYTNIVYFIIRDMLYVSIRRKVLCMFIHGTYCIV